MRFFTMFLFNVCSESVLTKSQNKPNPYSFVCAREKTCLSPGHRAKIAEFTLRISSPVGNFAGVVYLEDFPVNPVIFTRKKEKKKLKKVRLL